eukprot:88511-Pleurochrysis_carterae.AAC.3
MSAWIRWPGYKDLYSCDVCGSRVAFASVQASHPSWDPQAKDDGASAVMFGGKARRRVAPMCSRRYMWRVASDGDMMPTRCGGRCEMSESQGIGCVSAEQVHL